MKLQQESVEFDRKDEATQTCKIIEIFKGNTEKLSNVLEKVTFCTKKGES